MGIQVRAELLNNPSLADLFFSMQAGFNWSSTILTRCLHPLHRHPVHLAQLVDLG